MLELVDRTNLSFVDFNHKRSNRFSGIFIRFLMIIEKKRKRRKRGYSLIGKTPNLHFVNLGSSPDISIDSYILARKAQLVERNTEDV